MGQTLSEPAVEKHTEFGEDQRFVYGVSEMQGWRLAMEDAHAAVLDLDSDPASPDTAASSRKNAFFAVYDGHGGSSIAKFSGDTVHHRLRAMAEYKAENYEDALKKAFLATDDDLRNNPDFQHDPSGCTAVAALVTHDGRVIVANAGDSRSVLSKNGEAQALSFDHKPVNRTEKARITAAGGFVEFGRVNGNLALSRAIGDFEFKRNTTLPPEQQIVTVDPEITVHQITPEDEFVVIACDGIWDVLSNQQVVDWIRRAISERKTLQDIAEQMLDRCLAPDSDWGGVGCDNMTIMIIALLGGRTKEEWYDMVAGRMVRGEGYPTPTIQHDPFSVGPRAAAGLPHQPTIKADGLPPNLVAALRATGLLREDPEPVPGQEQPGPARDEQDLEMSPQPEINDTEASAAP